MGAVALCRDGAVAGTVYLLHFSQPYHHARHYLGWTQAPDANARFEAHVRGQGNPLVRAAIAAGSTVELARTWEGACRNFERRLKNQRQTPVHCPLCREARLAQKARNLRAARAKKRVGAGV